MGLQYGLSGMLLSVPAPSTSAVTTTSAPKAATSPARMASSGSISVRHASPRTSSTGATTARSTAKPKPTSSTSHTDPRYGTCKEAKAHGLGPYYQCVDPEYDWYKDADSDGVVCE
jgi:RecB family exonuclease